MCNKVLVIFTHLLLGVFLVFGCIQTKPEADERSINRTTAITDLKVPEGFTFLRDETFSCGGQTNTMEIYKHKKTGLEFVLLPGEEGIKSFLMSRTEATQGAWKRIMGTAEWRYGGELRPYVKEGGEFPAVLITWDDATSFCKQADLRLPTECEWEFACRAGTKTRFCFGDTVSDLDDYAWHYGNAEAIDEIYAHCVGQKKPNAFGLYDVHGNVSEWCRFRYFMGSNDYSCSATPDRILRGGSYSIFDQKYSSASRNAEPHNAGSSYIGFRPACSLQEVSDENE